MSHQFSLEALQRTNPALQIHHGPRASQVVMQGDFARAALDTGVWATRADCRSLAPFQLSEPAEGAIAISLCLGGERRFRVDGHEECMLSPGQFSMLAADEGVGVSESWAERQTAASVGIALEADFAATLLQEDTQFSAALASLSGGGRRQAVGQSSPELTFLARQLDRVLDHGSLSGLYGRGIAYAFIGEVGRIVRGAAIVPESAGPRLRRELETFHDALQAEPFRAWNIAAYARGIGLSESRLRRAFASHYRISIANHLRLCRLDRAHELLAEGRLSIGEVAYDCGYGNTANFTNAFRLRFGRTPGRLRES